MAYITSLSDLLRRACGCFFFVGWMLLTPSIAGAASASPCEADGSQRPYLKITTLEGPIVIEMFEGASPASVRRITELVRGPVFNTELLGNSKAVSEAGYYDGLSFNLTYKRLHISTSERMPKGLLEWPLEIDAVALGLDQATISSSGEAMDTWQMRLLKFYYRGDKQREMSGMFPQWLQQWNETKTADFLIGVSEKEINEAMGYVYTSGLDSRPVLKGSVVLEPATTASAVTPALRIILQDMPLETGRWMVVGQVVEGLELAEDISLRPLITPSEIKPRDFTPAKPVVIESARIECRE